MSKQFPKEVYIVFDDVPDECDPVMMASDDVRHLGATDSAKPAAVYVLKVVGSIVNTTSFETIKAQEETE